MFHPIMLGLCVVEMSMFNSQLFSASLVLNVPFSNVLVFLLMLVCLSVILFESVCYA